jgi:hypothetical protein
VTVTLSSSDTTKVTLAPGPVTVLAGQTTASTQVNGVNIGSANITATAPGYTQASAPVQVNATLSFTQQNLTISGFTTQNLTLNLSGNAPAAGLTVNLSSSSTNVTVAATATFAGGTNTVQVPVTGAGLGSAVIHASLLPNIPDVTTTVTVQSAGGITLPTSLSVGLGGTATLTVTLPTAAPAGGVTVTLTSSDTTKATVPASVSIAAGATTPQTQPLVTGVNLGTGATITASAPGYTSGSTPVTVTGSINFSQSSVTITGLTTQNVTLNLSGPAPTGGIAITLTSANTAVATVPASVTFSATTTSVSVPITTLSLGTAVIHASATNLADTTVNVTVVAAGPIVLPSSTAVQLGSSTPFTVTLPVAAPTGGVTVTLTSSDTTKVTVSSSVFIAAGATTPQTQAVVNGVNVGSATISASATGYTSATSGPVQVSASVSFGATDITLPAFTTQNITLTLSAAAPAAGVTVNLGSSDQTVATVPSSVTFLQHQTTVNIPVTTLKVGACVIDASGTNIPDTTVNLSVQNISLGTLTVSSVNVGENLEAQVDITINPAPPNGMLITLNSGDATKLALGQSPKTAGSGSVQFQVPAGSGLVSAYAQGLANSGQVPMTATALGWTSGSGIATLSPGGFVLTGPTGVVGVPTFPTNVSIASTLTVSSARLDSSMNFAEFQPVSGGVTVTVPITSSNTSQGTVSPTSVTFNGFDSSYTTQFNALAVGNPTITAGVPSVPAGFSQPAGGANVLTANIAAVGVTPGNATVGNGLETNLNVQLSGVPSTDITATITSNDPTRLLFSATTTDAGSSSIPVKIKAGFSFTPDFYAYGLANSGAVTYTAVVPGFGMATGTITLRPSGVVISGPSGFGYPISTTSLSSPTNVTVYAALLDPGNNFVSTQAVAGNVSVNVTSSNTAVGTITTSPVTIPAGTDRVLTQFQPDGPGSTTLSVNQPLSATPGQNTTVTATVGSTGIGTPTTDGASIGRFLEIQSNFILGAAAPTGGVTVTLKSNSSNLLLSTSPTAAGSSQIIIQVNAGNFGGESQYAYYVQALDPLGAGSYTVEATGYVSHTSSMTVTPAGVVIWDGVNVGDTIFASVGVNTPVYMSMAQLDSSDNFGAIQQLAPGHTVTANLGVTGSGTLTPSSVSIAPGADTATTQFLCQSSGSATIAFVGGPPSGFTTPAQGATLSVFIF